MCDSGDRYSHDWTSPSNLTDSSCAAVYAIDDAATDLSM